MDPAAPRISRLAGNNFHNWKSKMQMVLEERGLWDETCRLIMIEHCVAEEGQAMYRRKSHKSFSMICPVVKDLQLRLGRTSLGASDTWSCLEAHLDKKSLAHKIFLRDDDG